jgi:hypothetical protein
MLRTQAILVFGTMILATMYALYLPVAFAPTPLEDGLVADPALVEQCAAYLPEPITLDTRFARYKGDHKDIVTVRQRLLEIAAYPNDHWIYTWDGRPIDFFTPLPRDDPPFTSKDDSDELAGIRQADQQVIDCLRIVSRKRRDDRLFLVIVLYPTSDSPWTEAEYVQRLRRKVPRGAVTPFGNLYLSLCPKAP